MIENLYPSSPQAIPQGFTQPDMSYKKQVVYVLLAMLVFLMLYLVMIAAAAYVVYWAVMYPMETINKFTLLLKAGSVAVSVMLFAFLLKFLFKQHDVNNPANIEITEAEHPKLFAFVKKLCQETNAPFPHKIFVNHEINACVFYNSTILSLFLPVKKNLLIGLGLVNTLNMSEFKAVLAHEFGHFGQSSMKLGSYVYMANQIIYSMVYDRDKWDEWLDQWKRSDFRIAVFAWLLMPVIWLIRKCMAFIYQGINLIHASLSRQMEFHADRVAVSVTGSDAIVNALYKLGPSSEAFAFSNDYLSTAVDHKLYTNNLFYHHTKAIEYLSTHRKDFRESLLANQIIATTENRFLFKNEDGHLSPMYATHPSNYKREQHAKAIYIAGQVDEQSPWLLFNEPETLSEKVTRNLLTMNLNLPQTAAFVAAQEVQAFVEAEVTETSYYEKYCGVYQDRLLTKLDTSQVQELIIALGIKAEELKVFFDQFYEKELPAKMKVVENRQKDLQTLSLVLQKQDKRKGFTLSDGRLYPAQNAQQLFDQMIRDYESDNAWYKLMDEKVFAMHYLMAEKLEEQKKEFLSRYQFHMNWQELYERLIQMQQDLQDDINALIKLGNTTDHDLKNFASKFTQSRAKLEDILATADRFTLPQFNNTASIYSVSRFLLDERITEIYVQSVDGQQLNKLIEQTAIVAERMRRIMSKSLGGILTLQEQLAYNYSSQKITA